MRLAPENCAGQSILMALRVRADIASTARDGYVGPLTGRAFVCLCGNGPRPQAPAAALHHSSMQSWNVIPDLQGWLFPGGAGR